MTLHLTRDEADRLTADRRVVLFRAGEPIDDIDRFMHALDIEGAEYRPPAEFVEAAKPWCPADTDGDGNCALCARKPGIHGKRRVAVVVPCYCKPIREAGKSWPYGDCLVPEPCTDGFVTVGHVVVEWGPWLVVESWVGARANPHKVACLSHNGFLDWRWSSDDLTLVGQYAIGVEVVDQ